MNVINNIEEFVKKLPLNIILHIIPYTYMVQEKQLLDDIHHYNDSKKILLQLYYQYWNVEMRNYFIGKNNYLYWLLNDIFAYANEYIPSRNGYNEKFYEIFKRNTRLVSKQQIDKYIHLLEQKQVSTQINIFLGLLTIKERNDIIQNFEKEIMF